MSDPRFAELEQQLLTTQAALTRRLDAIRSDRRREAEPLDPDFAEQAVQRENDETLDGLALQGRRELEEIEHALRRLEAGTYGDCTGCGEPIPEKRLRAYPTAAKCIGCAS